MESPTNETMTPWLTQRGPFLPAAEVRQAAPDQRFIVFDASLIIDIDHLPEASKLVFSANLGRALAGEENATCALLLQVNALWRETGGLRMALDAGDGALPQVCDIALAGLDRDALERSEPNAAAAARGWREISATEVAVNEVPRPPTTLLTRV